VAIGDASLSLPARAQLIGRAGYFRGYSGLLNVDGEPVIDRHGGPIICSWMQNAGYADLWLRTPAATWPTGAWREKLERVALSYTTDSVEESVEVAQAIDFMEGDVETSSSMCGPLVGAILRDTGLLPRGISKTSDLHNF